MLASSGKAQGIIHPGHKEVPSLSGRYATVDEKGSGFLPFRERPLWGTMRAALAAMSVSFAGVVIAAEGPSGVEEGEIQALGQMVVTATMTEQDTLSSPAFTTVITPEDIANSSVNSLPDLLRDTVGLNNVTTNEGRDEIQIRGLDGRYTLILVNGKRVSSSGAAWRGADLDLGTVPLGSIERIEVVRGPMSSLYGSDAIGGVVNIITKRPGKDWHGEVSADYRVVESGDGGNQSRVNASASGALSKNVSLFVAGEFYDRDAWYQNSSSNPTEPSAIETKRTRNLVSTLTAEIDKNNSIDIDLGYNHDNRPYEFDEYAYYPAWNYENYSYSSQKIERFSLGLAHTGKWSWGKSFTSIKREQAKIDEYDSDYDDPKQRSYDEENTYINSYAVTRLGSHSVTAGVDFRDQVIKDATTYLDTGKVSTRQFAVFAQDEVSLGKDWLLTLGGRADHHDEFGFHFSPKAYLNYFIADGVVLKGGASMSYKAPDAYQLSKEYRMVSCGGSCYLSGNPDLTPEKGVSFEFGMEMVRRGWNISAALFHNDVKDMIVAVYDASGPSRAWQNIAKAKTSGLELDGSVALNKALTFKGNLTVLNAEYTDASGETVKLEFRPQQKAMLGLDWKISDTITSGVAFNYVGEQYYQEEKLPSYTRVDLMGAARISKSLTLRAGVKNLTDVNLKDKSALFVGSA